MSTKTMLDLVPFSVEQHIRATVLLKRNPAGFSKSYRAIKEENPSFEAFMLHVYENAGSITSDALWFRIWAEMEFEKQEGSCYTMDNLSRIPEEEYWPVNIDWPNRFHSKPLGRCLQILSFLTN